MPRIPSCSSRLIDLALSKEYEPVKERGDKLTDLKEKLNLGSIRFGQGVLYYYDTKRGGRLNIDVIVMLKLRYNYIGYFGDETNRFQSLSSRHRHA